MIWTIENINSPVLIDTETALRVKYVKSFNDETGEAEFYVKLHTTGSTVTPFSKESKVQTFKCYLNPERFRVVKKLELPEFPKDRIENHNKPF